MPSAHVVIDKLACQLGDKPFLVGNAISLADVLVAPQLDFLRQTPEWHPLTASHAGIRVWLERIGARPSMVATTWERLATLANAA